MTRKHSIYFFYPSGPGMMGQQLASMTILELLAHEQIQFEVVETPFFDRVRKPALLSVAKFLSRVAFVWLRYLGLALKARCVVYLNLGQSAKALLCDGIPFYLLSLLRPGTRSVVSLHGHFFHFWEKTDFRLRLLVRVIKRSRIVTVLGVDQKERLVKLGVPEQQIRIVNNTCERGIEVDTISTESENSVNILYLSNLIEAKGYKDYLLSMKSLSQLLDSDPSSVSVSAILCGQLMATSLDRTSVDDDDTHWIGEQVDMINESQSVTIEWKRGAYGHEKASLLRKTNIFVYPSRVDAQPIVIIEAMASGCAIVASDVGDIGSMLDKGAGVCIPKSNPEKIAKVVYDLVLNGSARERCERNALVKYRAEYSREAYKKNWCDIFYRLCS